MPSQVGVEEWNRTCPAGGGYHGPGRLLAPLGFVHRSKAWHHRTQDHQVSLCAEDTKFGIAFGVKYLTLALWHLKVEAPPGVEFRPLKNNSWLCPVRVSPALLPRLVEGGFDPGV